MIKEQSNNNSYSANSSIKNWNKIELNGMTIYSPKLEKQPAITIGKGPKTPFLETFDTYKRITTIKNNKSLSKNNQKEIIQNIISSNSKIPNEIEIIKESIKLDIQLLNTYKNIHPIKKMQNIIKLKLILECILELHKKQKALKKYQKLLSQYQR